MVRVGSSHIGPSRISPQNVDQVSPRTCGLVRITFTNEKTLKLLLHKSGEEDNGKKNLMSKSGNRSRRWWCWRWRRLQMVVLAVEDDGGRDGGVRGGGKDREMVVLAVEAVAYDGVGGGGRWTHTVVFVEEESQRRQMSLAVVDAACFL